MVFCCFCHEAFFPESGKTAGDDCGIVMAHHKFAALKSTASQFSRCIQKVRGARYAQAPRKRAEELVELMEKTKAELTSSNENIGGDIYIGCGETESISF